MARRWGLAMILLCRNLWVKRREGHSIEIFDDNTDLESLTYEMTIKMSVGIANSIFLSSCRKEKASK